MVDIGIKRVTVKQIIKEIYLEYDIIYFNCGLFLIHIRYKKKGETPPFFYALVFQVIVQLLAQQLAVFRLKPLPVCKPCLKCQLFQF